MSTICDGYQVFLKVESPGHPKTTHPLSPALLAGEKGIMGYQPAVLPLADTRNPYFEMVFTFLSG